MAYDPYIPNLAEIYQNAGAIKAQQQRSQLADYAVQQQQREQAQQQGIDDASRLSSPSLADYAQRAGQAGIQAFGERQKVQTQLTQQDQLKHLASSAVVANSANPKATAQQYAPDLIASYEQINGPGSFVNLSDDQVKTAAQNIHEHLLAQLTPPDVQYKEGAQGQRTQAEIASREKEGDLTRSVTILGQNKTDARDRQGQGFANIRSGLNADGTSNFGASGPNSGLGGDAFLATLPSAQQAQVKALADGRMQFPGGFALKSPYWQQMLSAVSQYDPNFDAVNYNARASARKDFTSGKSAQNIKSLNTAIGHLGTLDSQISGTASHSFTPLNTAENYVSSKFGSSGPTQFDQTAGALASELTAVFRGSGGAEADVKRYLSELSSNASLEQKKAAVANITELLASRTAAIGDQYNKGMGKTEDPLTLLDPKAAAVLQRIQGGAGEAAGGSSPQTAGAPVKVNTPAEAMQLPPGTQFVTPDGRVKVR